MKYKKGLTLVEIVAYLFILQILIIFLATITMKLYYTYNYVISKNILGNSMENTFFTVRNVLNDDNIIKTKYDEHKITVYLLKENNYYIKEIKMKESYLYIYYYESLGGEEIDKFLSANQLLENIKEINFIKKNKIMYMKIKTIDNEEYIECI